MIKGWRRFEVDATVEQHVRAVADSKPTILVNRKEMRLLH